MNGSDKLNPRRLIRAIEIELSKTKQKSQIQKVLDDDCILIGLNAPNALLYQKVDKWLELRIKRGMIEEVRRLIESGVSTAWLENLGLEYRWISRLVLGSVTRPQAISGLKGNIHSYVRRQKTWFKKFDGMKVYDVSQKNWQKEVEKDIKKLNKD